MSRSLPMVTVALSIALHIALSSASAQDDIVQKLTAPVLQEILVAEGLQYDKTYPAAKEGDPAIITCKVGSHTVLLFIPDSGVSCQGHFTIMYPSGDLRRINDWNRNSFFTKASLLSDGAACLNSDMHVDGGVTRKALGKQMKFFCAQIEPFVKAMADK